MQKKNRIKRIKRLWIAGACLAAGLLCGCTRKEELVFLTQESMPQEAGVTENADISGTAPAFPEEAATAKQPGVSAGDKPVTEKSEETLLCVHVCGAVEAPGVYELPTGSRVCDAVQAAGGFSADADQNYVNQAQILTDGVKLVIPTGEEAAAAKASAEAGAGRKTDEGTAVRETDAAGLQIGVIGETESSAKEAARTEAKVNINTASQKELCNIPGVGETRAAAIVSYRESHGSFGKPEDIMKVSGIKEGMYEKIKDSISVE